VDYSMNNLIVGSTSQISHYFPSEYHRVSSRNYESALNTKWDAVYICFGENRTFLANTTDNLMMKSFYDVNHTMTIDVVERFSPISRKVVVYSTADLWNDTTGPIDINRPFQFKSNHYIMSKYAMSIKLKDKSLYPNVSVAYPFNFNGIYRKGEFLFGKVFDSIINKKPITLGDTYYYRDILHPSMVANESMSHDVGEDFMIGSGRLTFVNDLIRELYKSFNLSYNDLVKEEWKTPAQYRNRIFYSANQSINPTNETVINLLIKELKGAINGG
jgi:hypothetical protein